MTGDTARGGFTLIEISIVLVIIGLIVGGVLVGQHLIEMAKLRKVYTEVEQVKLAANAFRLKYNCIPGDCVNATIFFPTGVCNGTSSESTAVACNGNGNGKVGVEIWWQYPMEAFFFWRELNAAGLFTPALADSIPCRDWACTGGWGGENVPSSSWRKNAIMYIANNVTIAMTSVGWGVGMMWIPTDYTNSLVIGPEGESSAITTGIWWNNGGSGKYAFTHSQAQWIDTKFDDGYASTGRIIGGGQHYCFDITSTGNPVRYGNDSSGLSNVGCGLVFLNLF